MRKYGLLLFLTVLPLSATAQDPIWEAEARSSLEPLYSNVEVSNVVLNESGTGATADWYGTALDGRVCHGSLGIHREEHGYTTGTSEVCRIALAPQLPDAEPSVQDAARRCDRGDSTGCADLVIVSSQLGTQSLFSRETSISQLEPGCEAGYPPACAWLGAMVGLNQMFGGPPSGADEVQRGVVFAQQACDANDPFGCMVYGFILYNDLPGNPPNLEEGVRALRQSCDRGERRACAALEEMQ
jgi:hypothetical protein